MLPEPLPVAGRSWENIVVFIGFYDLESTAFQKVPPFSGGGKVLEGLPVADTVSCSQDMPDDIDQVITVGQEYSCQTTGVHDPADFFYPVEGVQKVLQATEVCDQVEGSIGEGQCLSVGNGYNLLSNKCLGELSSLWS